MLRKNKIKSYAGLITKLTRDEINQLHKIAKPILKKEGIFIKRAPRSLDYGRMLLIVPRKVGPAVLRNQFKRRLKSIFFQNKLYERPFDLIVYINPEAQHLTFMDLHEILTNATHENN